MVLRTVSRAAGRSSECPCPPPCQCSYTTLLRARVRAALRVLPLLRTGLPRMRSPGGVP